MRQTTNTIGVESTALPYVTLSDWSGALRTRQHHLSPNDRKLAAVAHAATHSGCHLGQITRQGARLTT